jgi:hypothetical protein
MKTITNDRKRANYFNAMIDNYCNGNLSDAKDQLNGLSKIDLIRLTNKLRFYDYKLYIDITPDKKLNFFENE